MPANSRSCRWLLIALLTQVFVPALAWAEGVGISTPPDSVDNEAEVTKPFHRFRPGVAGQFIYRDLEFHWDKAYARDSGSSLSDSTITALSLLRAAIVDSVSNPFRGAYADFNLIYDYFRRQGSSYTRDANDITSVVLGRNNSYPAADRSHVDYYLPHPDTFGGGGAYPSTFVSTDEDASTGGTLRHDNSVSYVGPRVTQLGTLTWTGPSSAQVWGFDHELQHALPPDQGGRWTTEMFSACAEAIGGVPHAVAAQYEVSYTASLLARPEAETSCGLPASTVDNNYSGRRQFASYLAYNFRGADTTAVLPGTYPGFSDDLVWQWVRSESRNLHDLSELLDDSPAFIAKVDPAGGETTAFGPNALFGFLHHNWRVANYLNAPSVGDGRFGYPVFFNFKPSTDTGAWQRKDDCDSNDVVSIPPEVSLAHDWSSRSITRVGLRTSDDGVNYPMAVQPLGAEYWIARSGNMNSAYGRSLVVTVSGENTVATCATGSGRLMASVATYGAGPDSLWDKPGLVQEVQPVQWADVDSLSPELEFVVPDFGNAGAGTPRMATVTTISLGGPGGLGALGTTGGSVLPINKANYRITHDLVSAPYSQPFAAPLPSRLPIVSNAGKDDLSPCWSPGGQEIAYVSDKDVVEPRIYRRPFAVGSLNQTQSAVHVAPDSVQLDPDWSPRGDWITFAQGTAPNTTHLYAMNLQTNKLARLTSTSGVESHPVFQPNGQGLAYVRTTNSGGKKVALYWRNLTGSLDSVLVGPGDATPISSPRWSWDGSRVYFTRGDSAYSVRIAGRVVESLPAPVGVGTTLALDAPRGAGNWIVEEIAASTDTCGQPQFPVYKSIDSHRLGVKSPLANGPSWGRFQKRTTDFYGPRISLDGTRAAYAATESLSTTERDIHVGIFTYDHPPVMNAAAADSSLEIGRNYVLNLATGASDADGDAIYYKAAYLPISATFSGSTFTWDSPEPAGTDSTFYVVFVAYDSAGAQDYRVIRYKLVPGVSGGGCPFADVLTGSGWVEGNSISKRSASLALGVDAYRLPADPVLRGGRYSIRIRENESEESSIDHVSLLLVDHAPTIRTMASGDRILQGSYLEPSRITDANGGDLTRAFVGAGASGMRMNPGETLLVEFGTAEGSRGMGALSASPGLNTSDEGGGYGMESDSKVLPEEFRTPPPTALASLGPDDRILSLTGIDLQIPDGEGAWRTVERHYPRERLDASAFATIPPGPVRMVFAGRHRVRGLGRIVPIEGARIPVRLEPATALHSRLGSVRDAAAGDGNGTTTLVRGDTLTLEFAATAPESGLVRDFYLVTSGAYRSETSSAGAGRGVVQAAPIEFALGAARPNPTRGVTTIPFSLPTRLVANLKVFNASGRLVRTLIATELEAGPHEVEWDRRADGGSRVAAGMYFYQLVVPGREATRKIVILGE